MDKGFILEGDVCISFFLGFILLDKKKKFLNFGLMLISYLIIVIFMNSKKEKLIKLVKIKIVNIIALDLE